MKRLEFVKEAKVTHIAVSALMLVMGALLMIFDYELNTAVRIMVGVGFIVVGSARMLGYFANDLYHLAFQFDLAFGLFNVILGIFILTFEDNALSFLIFAVGIYVLLDGLLKLQIALDAKKFGMSRWVILTVSSLVVVALGVILMIELFNRQLFNQIFSVGLALAVDSAENIWNTMYTVRVRAKKKNASEMLGHVDEKDKA